ncbi:MULTISPECIES: GNAT family N-acetyltransferase [unclassified Algibacter]|uniref:GNAT family N-acetyltransferase n=1 Tax=unclassified Algibacter TaxID=2615009 RepID=UPI00131A9F07|nr:MULTISPECIES: GNAT family N-acetyltransferase [unclassified Algibacter]MCL5126834.1 GNAT family N-acetyltransferase [Algibacter sp. L4_22]
MIEISTDKSKLQIDVVHHFITNAYWAKGRTVAEVKKTIEHCFCFGVYLDDKQIGFARIATDYTVFAYLMDVFILKEHRGKGYSKELIEFIHEAEELKSCKVWMLKTADAHGLYKQFGYTALRNPEKVMERILK